MTYGCHNRAPLKTTVVVQAGWFMDGVTRTPRMVSVPNPMTKDCQFTRTALGQADAGCLGCRHSTMPAITDNAGHASPLGAALAPLVARSDKGNNTAAARAVKPLCGGFQPKEAAWHV